MSNAPLVFNGINAVTGEYLLPGLSPGDIARVALGERIDSSHLVELKRRHERRLHEKLGPIEGIDACNLGQAGWGVVFAHNADPALREALSPLLRHRQAQAGDRYREFFGADGYRPGETKTDFLARCGVGPGPVDPQRMPYYLLLIGDPEEIPYRFQYLLDVQFAVGRIAFDAIGEYAAYATSVVRAETCAPARAKRAAFFGVRNPNDRATRMSADDLVAPLAQQISQTNSNWTVQTFIEKDTFRSQLKRLLGGNETPQLLFTASHGMGFPCGHALQRPHQGALLCQDWMGPLQHHGPIPREAYLAGEDIAEDAELTGMIAFFFACFGAGTPRLDDFGHQAFTNPRPIAPQAFVASLPRRMLGQPNGALAVIAHVERAWGYSFSWPGVGAQRQVFESALQRLLNRMPIGYAMEFFNGRYAELATMISTEVEDAKFSAKPDELKLAGLWTALHDARSYVILGDPAASLN